MGDNDWNGAPQSTNRNIIVIYEIATNIEHFKTCWCPHKNKIK